MSTIYKRGNADVRANLTPMIDVTFLLIVFFVLVSQIVEVEHVDMDLPQPEDAVSFRLGDEQRVVINIVPAEDGEDGEIEGYRLGTRQFSPDAEGVERLSERLAEMYAANPTMRINLRADRATRYERIDPVMQAIARAARRAGHPEMVARVHLVVLRED